MKPASFLHLWSAVVALQVVTMPVVLVIPKLRLPIIVQYRSEIMASLQLLVVMEMPIPAILLLLVLLHIRSARAHRGRRLPGQAGDLDHEMVLDLILFGANTSTYCIYSIMTFMIHACNCREFEEWLWVPPLFVAYIYGLHFYDIWLRCREFSNRCPSPTAAVASLVPDDRTLEDPTSPQNRPADPTASPS